MQGKKKIRQSNRTQQKNKRGNNKMESNDTPEVQDRWDTLDILSLPSQVMGSTVF